MLGRWQKRLERDGWRAGPRWAMQHLAAPVPQASKPQQPICTDMLGWLKAHPEIEYKLIRDGLTIERCIAHTVEPTLDPIFLEPKVEIPPFFMACIPNALTRGWRNVNVLPDGQYPCEITYYSEKILAAQEGFNDPLPDTIRDLQGDYFVVPLPWWLNYGHWMIDVLSRLWLAMPHLPSNVRFVVPDQMQRLQLETLRLMGIDRDRMTFIGLHETLKLERMWYAPLATRGGADPAPIPQELGAHLSSALGIETRTRHDRRIFVTRQDFSNRRIINNDEVIDCFRRYGFEIFSPKGVPLRDEVAMYMESDIIAQNSGSGLCNALFARPGGVTLDLIDRGYFNVFSWSFASSMEREYWYLFGETQPGVQPQWPDLHIPIPTLEQTLERIVATRPR